MPQEYVRSNFMLASTLVCEGHRLVDIRTDEKNVKKKLFVFHDSPELQETVLKYWGSQLLVNPLRLGACQKEIKDQLFDR